MRKRLAKKRIDRAVTRALSLPMVLAHAKPSLWTLPVGTQRTYVARTMVEELRVHPRHAWHATRMYFDGKKVRT